MKTTLLIVVGIVVLGFVIYWLGKPDDKDKNKDIYPHF